MRIEKGKPLASTVLHSAPHCYHSGGGSGAVVAAAAAATHSGLVATSITSLVCVEMVLLWRQTAAATRLTDCKFFTELINMIDIKRSFSSEMKDWSKTVCYSVMLETIWQIS